MSNSVGSPDVITSIIFGIFASALGVLQVILFIVYRKNHKGSLETGESIPVPQGSDLTANKQEAPRHRILPIASLCARVYRVSWSWLSSSSISTSRQYKDVIKLF